jgi:outer membrane protein assembly factor BamB
MALHSSLIVVPLLLLTAIARADDGLHSAPPSSSQNWPQWRGPLGTGVAPNADPPVEWSETKNVRWKAELPGRGHSSPIVWGERVFLTTAVPYGDALPPRPSRAPGNHDNLPVTHRQQFMALAINRSDGRILWQRKLHEALPHEQGHRTASLASSSPVTDGERLFAFFGSFGLYCLDLDGKPLWRKDFGLMQSLHGHGEGASPALYGDTVVVNWDHEGQSFVVALDKRTGNEKWKVARHEVTSWATPIVVEHAGKPQVIISGTNRVRGYDFASGKVIWECGGLSANIVASPVSSGGVVFVGSSYDKRALLAIRLDGAKGDVTGTQQVLWSRSRGTPYVPSPLLYGDTLYFLTHYQGILNRVDARTGKDRPGPLRLPGVTEVYASPVGAADRIYITDRYGLTLVVSHSDTPRLLARNQLDDTFNASAAIAGRDLFLRGEKALYCLEDVMKEKSVRSYMSATQRRALDEEREKVPQEVRVAFELAFSVWKNAWFGGGLAMSSNPHTRAVGKEYDALIALGPLILPLVVDKLADPENFLALQLYDALQPSEKLLVQFEPDDERILEGEQGRAQRVVQAWFANQ